MYGLDPGIAPGSNRVYLSLWRDPRYSSLYFPGATSPVYPGLPTANVRGKVGSIVCSLTQSIHFLSYLVFSKPNIPISSLDFDSHPPSHNQMGFRVRLTRVSHSLRKRDESDLGPKLVGKQTVTFLLCRLPSYCSGSESEEWGNAITFPCCGLDPVRVCGSNAICIGCLETDVISVSKRIHFFTVKLNKSINSIILRSIN
jgi:hypothetical protein